MNKTILISLVLFVSGITYAQKDSSDNSLKKGKLALVFATTTFNLRSFEGATLALKWHISKKSALRLSFSVSINNENTDNVRDDTLHTKITNNENNYSLHINYLYYPYIKKALSFYLGGGLNSNYYYRKGESTDQYPPYINGYGKSDTWGGGINLMVGIEWFPVKFLGIFGEYYMEFIYNKSTSERKTYDSNTETYHFENNDSKFFNFNGRNANLGIAVYFDWPF